MSPVQVFPSSEHDVTGVLEMIFNIQTLHSVLPFISLNQCPVRLNLKFKIGSSLVCSKCLNTL